MIREIDNIYFLGAGGIGMSALVRYFLSKKKNIAGYDLTETPLTQKLIEEGCNLHFQDDVNLIPQEFKNPETTLVVYTPAIPGNHGELKFFKEHNFRIYKRAAILGEITKNSKGLCVAGTHGKTTTSSMLAHLLKQSHVDCNAFLGGILKNYDSNLLLSEHSDFTVIEADEYDRSFHSLHPYMAIITSADPDHLDIYGTAEAYRESFEYFTSLIQERGVLVMKKGIQLTPRLKKNVRLYTYSASEKADFYADNIRIGNGHLIFDFYSPISCIKNLDLGVPVRINVENAVAALAVAQLNGVNDEELRLGISSFSGSKRRFDRLINTEKLVLIDDYAHHPNELRASINSVRELYPNRKITGIFQPHLYSRTRDFYKEFAQALSSLDELILLDIYPAREEPIPGVTSQIILEEVNISDKKLSSREALLDLMQGNTYDVVLILGAGNIDRCVEPIKKLLCNR